MQTLPKYFKLQSQAAYRWHEDTPFVHKKTAFAGRFSALKLANPLNA